MFSSVLPVKNLKKCMCATHRHMHAYIEKQHSLYHCDTFPFLMECAWHKSSSNWTHYLWLPWKGYGVKVPLLVWNTDQCLLWKNRDHLAITINIRLTEHCECVKNAKVSNEEAMWVETMSLKLQSEDSIHKPTYKLI